MSSPSDLLCSLFPELFADQRIYDEKNSCNGGEMLLLAELPNFARACGRVSVGGHPDKRPDSRPDPSVFSMDPIINRQPEAKPAYLVLPEGRDLKQRRSGLFWSLCALQRHGIRRGLSIFARRAEGTPSNPRQQQRLDHRNLASPTRRGGDATAGAFAT